MVDRIAFEHTLDRSALNAVPSAGIDVMER